MELYEFEDKHNVDYEYGEIDNLPCYASRFGVTHTMCSETDIKQAIKFAVKYSNTSLIMFSVTERDGDAWKAWKKYAIDHPRTFSVVEGKSIHGPYKCRMYFYKRPVKRNKGLK